MPRKSVSVESSTRSNATSNGVATTASPTASLSQGQVSLLLELLGKLQPSAPHVVSPATATETEGIDLPADNTIDSLTANMAARQAATLSPKQQQRADNEFRQANGIAPNTPLSGQTRRKTDSSVVSRKIPDLDRSGHPIHETVVENGETVTRQKMKNEKHKLNEFSRQRLRAFQRDSMPDITLAVLSQEQFAALEDAGLAVPRSHRHTIAHHATKDTGNMGYGSQNRMKITLVGPQGEIFEFSSGAGLYLMADSTELDVPVELIDTLSFSPTSSRLANG